MSRFEIDLAAKRLVSNDYHGDGGNLMDAIRARKADGVLVAHEYLRLIAANAQRILAVIEAMKVDPAITDVLWLPGDGSVTLAEELADIASELGATDAEIEAAFQLK